MKKRTKNDIIETSNIKIKPLIDDKGKVLNDMEFVDKALAMINEYENENKQPFPAPVNFVDYLRELKNQSVIKEVDNETGNETIKDNPNFNIVDYKKQTILKTVKYDQLRNVN